METLRQAQGDRGGFLIQPRVTEKERAGHWGG